MMAFCIMQLSYIVFLHQTTTLRLEENTEKTLSYIVFLHQTTTGVWTAKFPPPLSYIVFLHQTTTIHGRGVIQD